VQENKKRKRGCCKPVKIKFYFYNLENATVLFLLVYFLCLYKENAGFFN